MPFVVANFASERCCLDRPGFLHRYVEKQQQNNSEQAEEHCYENGACQNHRNGNCQGQGKNQNQRHGNGNCHKRGNC